MTTLLPIANHKPADTSLVSRAIAHVTAHIRDGELTAGDPVLSEAEVAKDLGVSRTVVREAFRSLAALRLIELSNGRRAVVATLESHPLTAMFEHGVSTSQISIAQIYDVRRAIEVRTATLAALRRTALQSEEISRHAAAMRTRFRQSAMGMEHDIAFHSAIAAASGNPAFQLIVDAMAAVTRQTWPVGWRSRSSDAERRAMVNLHIALATAIAQGNPVMAAKLMKTHFDDSTRALIAAGIA